MSAILIAGLATSVQSPVVSEATPTAAPKTQSAPSEVVKSRPDTVSARLAAEAQASRVQVTSLDTSNSTTFVNADGSMSTETSVTPLRVMRDGGWVPVDYDLEHVGDSWTPKAAPVPVSFSDGGDRDAATIGDGSKQVDLSWAVTLPAPTVDGATASYPLGDGQTLTLTATVRGFEQSLVLAHAPTTLPQIKLPLDTADLTMSADTADGYTFKTDAGKVVYAIRTPVMYDSSKDPTTGDPQSKVVDSTLVSTSDGARLDLTPSLAWLTDPARQYPVTIDPSLSAGAGTGSDTFVEQGTTAVQGGVSQLRLGEDVGDHPSRTYMSFGALSQIKGKHVTSASIRVWNNRARSCTASTVYAYPLSAAFAWNSTVWTNKPAANTSTAYSTSASFAHGTTGCNPAYESFDVKKLVTAWAAGTIPNYGVQLGGHEAAGAQYWYVCSMNYDPDATTSCNSAAHTPALTVTYNSVPSAPTALAILPSSKNGTTTYTNARSPRLSAKVVDADGGNLRHDFEVDTASGSVVATGQVSAAAGTSVSWAVPSGKIVNDGNYTFKVRGFDGVDYSSWSSNVSFTVDTAAPAAPSVSSTDWPAQQWSDPTTGSVSWSSSSSDSSAYSYQVDDGAWTDPTAATSKSFTLSTGTQHTVKVKAFDRAGNFSAVTAYTFGIGTGGLVSPVEGDSTTASVDLSAVGSKPYAYFQWRQGTTAPWTTIAASDLAPAPGTPPSQTGSAVVPLSATGGRPAVYTWGLSAAIAAARPCQSASRLPGYGSNSCNDGAIQLQACLSANQDGSSPSCQVRPTSVAVRSRVSGDTNPVTDLGPGSVALLTGDYEVGSVDATLKTYNGSLSIGKTLGTLNSSEENATFAGVYGPGWTSSFAGPDGGAAGYFVKIASDKSFAVLANSDGVESIYTAENDPSSDRVILRGLGDSDNGSRLAVTSDAVTLSEADGTRTSWRRQNGAWAPSAVVQAGAADQNTTSYYYNASGLISRIVGAAPSGIDCSTEAKATATQGCRSLGFIYSAVTIGNATVQRLTGISARIWNPDAGAMVSILIKSYDYDASGRLAHDWDPRIAPSLKTGYSYNSDKRIAQLSEPGLDPWNFTYDALGRVSKVARADGSGHVATSTVVYGVPLTGVDGLPDLSPQATSTWSQATDLPVAGKATAVFLPNHEPASTSASAVSAADWPFATITYADVNGRTVDFASYGAGAWQVESSRYDKTGNVTWLLSQDGRAQALSPTADTAAYVAAVGSSADRANLLATIYTYSADGTRLTEENGPMHEVALANGDFVDARQRSQVTYDEGAPNNNHHLVADPVTNVSTDIGSYGLPTTSRQSVTTASFDEFDVHATKYGYDAIVSSDARGWDIASPSTTGNDGGPVEASRASVARQQVQTRAASDSEGTTSRSTAFTYYSPSGSAACASDSNAGLLCASQPASQAGLSTALPVTTYDYDLYGNVVAKYETFGTGSSQAKRTTRTTYDAAERTTAVSVSVTPAAAGGIALPQALYDYSPTTGLPTTTSTTLNGTSTSLSTTYDSNGRVASYTDASGVRSDWAYDLNGQISSKSDGLAVTSFEYGSSSERRSLATKEHVTISGTTYDYQFSYGPGGDLSQQTLPGGVTARQSVDLAGNLTATTIGNAGINWLTSSTDYSGIDKPVVASVGEQTRTATYDDQQRLTAMSLVQPNYSDGTNSCTTQVATYNSRGDRTKLAGYLDSSADDTPACQTSTPSSQKVDTFDDAGHVTTSGYAYDQLGRIVSLPAADVANSPSASGSVAQAYYANDVLASQTTNGQKIEIALDPGQDRPKTVSSGSGVETRHYSGEGSYASWVQASSDVKTENVMAPAGGTISTSGVVKADVAGPLVQASVSYDPTSPSTPTVEVSNSMLAKAGTGESSARSTLALAQARGKQQPKYGPVQLSVVDTRGYVIPLRLAPKRKINKGHGIHTHIIILFFSRSYHITRQPDGRTRYGGEVYVEQCSGFLFFESCENVHVAKVRGVVDFRSYKRDRDGLPVGIVTMYCPDTGVKCPPLINAAS